MEGRLWREFHEPKQINDAQCGPIPRRAIEIAPASG